MENERNWRRLYIAAAAAVILMIAFAMVDIGISMALPEGDVDPSSLSAADWFIRFQSQPLYALRDYGIFNIFSTVLCIPLYLALYHIHRKGNGPFALLAAALTIWGGGVYIANNTALPMLDLSRAYIAAPDTQRAVIEAAGTALLARGADFTWGSLIGLLLPSLGGLLMAGAVLTGGVFRKYVGYVGIVAYLSLTAFTVMTVLWPALFDIAMIIAMPGGVLILVWYIALACKLIGYGKKGGAKHEGIDRV